MADDDDLSPWERDLARHEAEIVGDPIFEQTVIDKPLRQSVRSLTAEQSLRHQTDKSQP